MKRRDFLKVSAAGASAYAMGNYIEKKIEAQELEMGGRSVSRTTEKERKATLSTCLNCYARCGIMGFVEYRRITKLEGNPSHPNSRGKLCAKGQAGVNLVYDPDRILSPMKRTGKRGEGKWEKISWQDALDMTAAKLKELKTEGHPEEFIFQSTRDITTQNLAKRFLYAYGSPNVFTDAYLGGNNKKVAHMLSWGSDLDISDVANTQYILNFGSNPYEAFILRTSFVQRIVEARSERIDQNRIHKPAKIVTFDARMSQTAGRSDEWHPIKPGTDAIVALAMANVIMEEGLYDREFIEKWTNYSPEKLSLHLKRYTLDLAEKESGVPAGDIRRVALEFAETKPATTISTGGVTKHVNGVYSERCIFLLNVITGNIDVKGGYCMPRCYALEDLAPAPQPPSAKSSILDRRESPFIAGEPEDQVLSKIAGGKYKCGVYMTYNYNPAYSVPDNVGAAAVLKDEKLIPFHVAIDSYYSETCDLADLILPSASYLERWELESPPAMNFIPFVSLRQPVVKPLGDSMAFTDIIIKLANVVGEGVAGAFPFKDSKDYVKQIASTIPGLDAAGGIDYLAQNGFWADSNTVPEYQSYKQKGFNTPSGKIEIYSERLEKAGFDPLPSYHPIEEHKSLKGDEFILVKFQYNVHTHDRTSNCMWLSEIIHHNGIWINADVAEKMGIKKEDMVKLTSKKGSITGKAWLTNGIHPQVIAVSDSCGHNKYGHVALAESFESEDPNTDFIWWEEEGNGVNPNPVIALKADPIGGGQSWMDTVVRVSKA